jgi:hypothetical protein
MGMKRFFIASFVSLIGSPILAQMSGNEFLEICESAQMDNFCSGYVSGGLATMLAIGAGDKGSLVLKQADGADQSLRDFCLPTGVTRRQTEEMVFEYLEQRPEERHFPMPWLIFGTMIDAFPCD